MRSRRSNRALEVALGGIAAGCLVLFAVVIGDHTGLGGGSGNGLKPIAAPGSAHGSHAITFKGSKANANGRSGPTNPFPTLGGHAQRTSAGISTSPSTGQTTTHTFASGGARPRSISLNGQTGDSGSNGGSSGSGGLLQIIAATSNNHPGLHSPGGGTATPSPTPSPRPDGNGHGHGKPDSHPSPGNNGRRGPPSWSNAGGLHHGKRDDHPRSGNKGRHGPPPWSKGHKGDDSDKQTTKHHHPPSPPGLGHSSHHGPPSVSGASNDGKSHDHGRSHGDRSDDHGGSHDHGGDHGEKD